MFGGSAVPHVPLCRGCLLVVVRPQEALGMRVFRPLVRGGGRTCAPWGRLADCGHCACAVVGVRECVRLALEIGVGIEEVEY